MLPLDPPPTFPPPGSNTTPAEAWDFGATPSLGLALRAEALVLNSCRLWCPPRPWSRLRRGSTCGDRRRDGSFLHRVSAHALACPANHVSGVRLLTALLPPESPAPLHRLIVPAATAAAAAAGVAAAATADAGSSGGENANESGGGGGGASIGRLVGRVHTAAALERSEGLRRQAVAALEHRVGKVLTGWDRCVAGDLFRSAKKGSGGDAGVGTDGETGKVDGDGTAGQEDDDGDSDGDGGDDSEASSGFGGDGGVGWRPELAANPLLAVTAPEALNVPAVVVSLCHSASPVLQRRVLELAKRCVGTQTCRFPIPSCRKFFTFREVTWIIDDSSNGSGGGKEPSRVLDHVACALYFLGGGATGRACTCSARACCGVPDTVARCPSLVRAGVDDMTQIEGITAPLVASPLQYSYHGPR